MNSQPFEIETRYLHENIRTIDHLLEKKAITMGEYLNIALQLKILERLDRYETILNMVSEAKLEETKTTPKR